MFVLLMTLDFAFAQTVTTAFDSVTFTFTWQSTMTGEVPQGSADIMAIEVKDSRVRQLTFSLSSISGNADLIVKSTRGTIEERWISQSQGTDMVIINEKDAKLDSFRDNKRMQRLFVAVVVAAVSTDTLTFNPVNVYLLIVTAKYFFSNSIVETMTLEELIRHGRTLEVMKITPILYDPAILMTESYNWQWITIAAAGVGLIAVSWIFALRACKHQKGSGYVLF